MKSQGKQSVCDKEECQELTLYSSQQGKGEKSIYRVPTNSEGDKEQMGQMVAPVNIPSATCYQTVENNPEVKQTEDINSLDL